MRREFRNFRTDTFPFIRGSCSPGVIHVVTSVVPSPGTLRNRGTVPGGGALEGLSRHASPAVIAISFEQGNRKLLYPALERIWRPDVETGMRQAR